MYKCKKIPYKTRKEALSAKKRHKNFDPGDPYPCKKCGFYHLGHEVPKKSFLGKIIKIIERKREATKAMLNLIDKICGVKDAEKTTTGK